MTDILSQGHAMTCNYLKVSNVHVTVKCLSEKDCELGYDRCKADCGYMETKISYDITRS